MKTRLVVWSWQAHSGLDNSAWMLGMLPQGHLMPHCAALQELSNDKAIAEADLLRTLGTLR